MGSRIVPFDETVKCDICREYGAFDFYGDYICQDCLEDEKNNMPCNKCGCIGNRQCDKIDDYPDDCTLNDELICPCCQQKESTALESV